MIVVCVALKHFSRQRDEGVRPKPGDVYLRGRLQLQYNNETATVELCNSDLGRGWILAHRHSSRPCEYSASLIVKESIPRLKGLL